MVAARFRWYLFSRPIEVLRGWNPLLAGDAPSRAGVRVRPGRSVEGPGRWEGGGGDPRRGARLLPRPGLARHASAAEPFLAGEDRGALGASLRCAGAERSAG